MASATKTPLHAPVVVSSRASIRRLIRNRLPQQSTKQFAMEKKDYKSFLRFFDDLPTSSDTNLEQNFEATVKLKWALDEKDRAIGMTEEEFYTT
jgi:hypothetical protein